MGMAPSRDLRFARVYARATVKSGPCKSFCYRHSGSFPVKVAAARPSCEIFLGEAIRAPLSAEKHGGTLIWVNEL